MSIETESRITIYESDHESVPPSDKDRLIVQTCQSSTDWVELVLDGKCIAVSAKDLVLAVERCSG